MSDLTKKTLLAVELQKIGVSQDGVYQLLANYPEEVIEAQLRYLPHRRAKRPEAFIVEAIRNNYSAPKEMYHAHPQVKPKNSSLDQSAEPASRPLDAGPSGHGAAGLAPGHPPDGGLGQVGTFDPLDLPDLDTSDW